MKLTGSIFLLFLLSLSCFGQIPNKYDSVKATISLSNKLNKKGWLNSDSIIYFINRGANIKNGKVNGSSLLIDAINQRNFGLVKCLIQNGIDINSVMPGESILREAIHDAASDNFYDFRISILLIENGAKINVLDIDGGSPLSEAIVNNYLNLVKMLIKYGASLELKNSKTGQTPLLLAVSREFKISKLLIEAGANIKALDTLGDNVLIGAVLNSDQKSIRYLIKNGADINHKNKRKQTPLDFAQKKEIIKLLLSYGAKHGYEIQ